MRPIKVHETIGETGGIAQRGSNSGQRGARIVFVNGGVEDSSRVCGRTSQWLPHISERS